MSATIETMRSQYTDLLYQLEQAEAALQKQVERREEEKLRAVQAEDDLAALKAQHRYPHMCRDGHPEIGHSTDNERCPVCLLRDRVSLALGG